MGIRARAAVLAATGTPLLVLVALAVLATPGGPPAAEAARTPFEQLALDSLVDDSAAFEALPPRLVALLDLRQHLSMAALDSLPFAVCDQLPEASPGVRRRRLQLRLSDTSVAILYAVAERESGSLSRVELIRRVPGAGQRGFIWDAARDRAQSVWWGDDMAGRRRRAERGDVPRSSPIPRVLRALGRTLNAMSCAETAATPP